MLNGRRQPKSGNRILKIIHIDDALVALLNVWAHFRDMRVSMHDTRSLKAKLRASVRFSVRIQEPKSCFSVKGLFYI